MAGKNTKKHPSVIWIGLADASPKIAFNIVFNNPIIRNEITYVIAIIENMSQMPILIWLLKLNIFK